jgi:hypothetical protein
MNAIARLGRSGLPLFCLWLTATPLAAQTPEIQPVGAGPASDTPTGVTMAGGRLRFDGDLTFAGVHDWSLNAAMGRERQVKIAYATFGASFELTDRISLVVAVNPAGDDRRPEPFVPGDGDRRTYFFPNRPEGRGVVSDPSGLYKVDDFKHPGLDPLFQQGALRLGYVDLHTPDRRAGVRAGRQIVPQGLPPDTARWFTAKDLTHMQRIDLQADNGAMAWLRFDRLTIQFAVMTGNGNPYHDYAYFDFTDADEDRNTDFGTVTTVRYRWPRAELGGSVRKNALNSRIEDATTIQLSKHNDDAVMAFGWLEPFARVRVFGEVARYRRGLSRSSAATLPGPPVKTPVDAAGYYVGAEVAVPPGRLGRWGVTWLREELDRNDALVAWAAANRLFGVELGARERAHVIKAHAGLGRHLTAFFFAHFLSNPYPELSAIVPVAGFGAFGPANNNKVGLGLRVRL